MSTAVFRRTLYRTLSDGSKVAHETAWYYGWVRKPGGGRARVRLTKDKETSVRRLVELNRQAEAGVEAVAARHVKAPLAAHLQDYRAHLELAGDTPKHVAYTVGAIEAALAGCGFVVVGDLSASDFEGWLLEGRKGTGEAPGWSARTVNFYLGAMRGFLNWMVRDRRLPASPFAHLRRLNTEVDQRRVRRALTTEDFGKLVAAACGSATSWRGLSGLDRAWLYNVAGYTGYRAGELASLTAASFRLDDDPPTVWVQAAHSRKRKELARQVLHPDLVRDLKAYLAGRDAQAPVWPGTWHQRAAEMLRADLKAAGIPYADEAGQVFDFHGLRGQFVTELARTGTTPRVAQVLARHSDVNLTMKRYTRVAGADEVAAIRRLPAPTLPGQVASENQGGIKSGTSDGPDLSGQDTPGRDKGPGPEEGGAGAKPEPAGG